MSEPGRREVSDLLRDAAARLRAAGLEEPRREARRLLERLLGLPALALWSADGRSLSVEQAADYEAVVGRRCRQEPPSRIFGEREFWSLPLALGPHTLDPRADSETLVAAVLARLPERGRPYRILDLGTGSGCLLLALLSELRQAWGLGVDLAPGALAVAAANARSLGLAERCGWVAGDWTAPLGGRFDVVVGNPPYVTVEEMAQLAPEVAHFDPVLALAGGADGLDAYRAIVPRLRCLLNPGGIVALEIGSGQSEPVSALLRSAGLAAPVLERDLGGLPRCLVAREAPRS